MPRGKYPRAKKEPSATPKAIKAQPTPPVAEPAKASAPEVATTSGRRPQRFADHPRSRDIDSLAGEELREYCRQIGMSGRDARELPEDRLRAGAKSHLDNHFAALLED
jgi:hypothetical protein